MIGYIVFDSDYCIGGVSFKKGNELIGTTHKPNHLAFTSKLANLVYNSTDIIAVIESLATNDVEGVLYTSKFTIKSVITPITIDYLKLCTEFDNGILTTKFAKDSVYYTRCIKLLDIRFGTKFINLLDSIKISISNHKVKGTPCYTAYYWYDGLVIHQSFVTDINL